MGCTSWRGRGLGDCSMNRLINTTFLRFSKRAETDANERLVQTFVDSGALATLLLTRDHQIIFGRRGTGKTHAFAYLASTAASHDYVAYVDMRQLGSSGGIYADASISLPERATRLLVDALVAIHDKLLSAILADESANLATAASPLDALAEAATQIKVVGTTATVESRKSGTRTEIADSANAALTASSLPTVSLGSNRTQVSGLDVEATVSHSGSARFTVHFGSVGGSMRDFLASIAPRRVWILLDEWSAVPADLQPYLADLFRRALLPVNGLTLKIAAIEQRSHFQLSSSFGDYIGIELGADASADLNLDDYMVFDNNADRATEFFQELVFRHYRACEVETDGAPKFQTSLELRKSAFTEIRAFQEFVRAAEGVPRDAINILSLAAQKADARAIAIHDIRAAAKAWYQRDKEKAVSANSEATSLLHKLIDKVIAHRQARAFLFSAAARSELIDQLFDARVLHILKKNISSPESPGARYNVYKIDYGCYVDLLTTGKGPASLFGPEGEFDEMTQAVPPDDYRAIRRAILEASDLA